MTLLPPSTTAGSTLLTFILDTPSTITPLDAVQSSPFTDTSTVWLPVAIAGATVLVLVPVLVVVVEEMSNRQN